MTILSTLIMGGAVLLALVATIFFVVRLARSRGILAVRHVKWQQPWDEWKEANDDWYTPFVVIPVLILGLLVYVAFWLPMGSWVYARMRVEQWRKM